MRAHNEDQRAVAFASAYHDCEVCFIAQPGEKCIQFLPFHHAFCKQCIMKSYVLLGNPAILDQAAYVIINVLILESDHFVMYAGCLNSTSTQRKRNLCLMFSRK